MDFYKLFALGWYGTVIAGVMIVIIVHYRRKK